MVPRSSFSSILFISVVDLNGLGSLSRRIICNSIESTRRSTHTNNYVEINWDKQFISLDKGSHLNRLSRNKRILIIRI